MKYIEIRKFARMPQDWRATTRDRDERRLKFSRRRAERRRSLAAKEGAA